MTAMRRFSGDRPEKKSYTGKSTVGKSETPKSGKPWVKKEEKSERPYKKAGDAPEKRWERKERSFDKNDRAKREDKDVKPWKKSDSAGKPWKSNDSAEKPWKKSDSAEKPWKRNDSAEKPWKKDDSSQKQWKKNDSADRPWKKDDSSEKPWKRKESSFDKSENRSDSHSDKPWRKRNSDDQDNKGSERSKSYSGFRNKDKSEDDKSGERYRRTDRVSDDKRKKPFERKENKKSKPGFITDEPVRLNKYIANAGICSRREADTMIEAGAVMINGKVVTEMGVKVNPGDKVQIGDETLNPQKKVYLLLNKPKGFITTVDDPQERNTVMMLVKDACRERIYPVGRLDRNTSGLLLMTNDGELAKKLTHPSHKVRKIYHVELSKSLSKTDMLRLTEGIELEDGIMAVDEIAYTGSGDDKKSLGVVIHSGRNRIVRRLFEALDYEVVKLDRVAFANLTKKDLPRGRWRFLEESEINLLMMI